MKVAGGSTDTPKNAGLLFFSETPLRFFPDVQFDLIWFPEGSSGIVSRNRYSRAYGPQMTHKPPRKSDVVVADRGEITRQAIQNGVGLTPNPI